MRVPYSFSILRYIHDPVTQEFVNVGVVVYSQQAGYLKALCSSHYARINAFFSRVDGSRFRQLTRFIESQVNKEGSALSGALPFEPDRTIEQLLVRVLPQDDSALQFSSPAGAGLSADLDRTLADLTHRYVELYAAKSGGAKRNNEDVWRPFREQLDKRGITQHLVPKRIVAANYDYEFQRAWKNGIWHLYEPVSFDLVDGQSIVEKANRWVGRATSLSDNPEPFKLHLLLGEPRDSDLQQAFVRAQNILSRMPGQTDLVREEEAEAFADELEREVSAHSL